MKRPYFRRSHYLRCDIQRVTFLLMLAVLVLVPLGGRAAWAEKRVALIIGNSAYVHTTPLANPLNDARDMTEAL
ncbi:MAG: caspase family protein, partial [Hyphomicrobium sp.]